MLNSQKNKSNEILLYYFNRTGIAYLFLAFNLLACSSNKSNLSGSNSQKSISTKSMIDLRDSALAEAKSDDYLEIEISRLFEASLDRSSNDPIEVGGHVFENTLDILVDNQDKLDSFADEFATVGDLLNSVGYNSVDEFDGDDLQKSYDMANSYLNLNANEESDIYEQQLFGNKLFQGSNTNQLQLDSFGCATSQFAAMAAISALNGYSIFGLKSTNLKSGDFLQNLGLFGLLFGASKKVEEECPGKKENPKNGETES